MKKDIQDYVRSGTPEQRKLFSRLERIILEMYPKAEIGIAYGVPTYGRKPGRVGLGYWKQGVSFFPYSGSALDAFRKAYPAIKTSTGTVNFQTSDKIPVAALKALIRTAMERTRSG